MSTQRIDRNDKRALLARFKAPSDLPLEVSGIVAEVVRPRYILGRQLHFENMQSRIIYA
jgi:hypothetical protein